MISLQSTSRIMKKRSRSLEPAPPRKSKCKKRSRSLSPRRITTSRGKKRSYADAFEDNYSWIYDPTFDAIMQGGSQDNDDWIFDDHDSDDSWIFDPALDAFMQGGSQDNDDWIFDDYDSDDSWIFDPALDAFMQGGGQVTPFEDVMQGGGIVTQSPPLLDFAAKKVGGRKNWKNVVNKQRYVATLNQHRDVEPTDNLGQELTQALRRMINNQISENNSLTPNTTVHFAMQSDSFDHAFQSTTFTVREFTEGSDRLDTYLQSLATKLNSNEEFVPDESFTMETTFINTPGVGRGRGKRYKPSYAAVRGITKRSRITVKNKDELCCARAIVTMKARLDGGSNDPTYKNIARGRPIQERRAKELHRLANVAEGPCGIAELKKFEAALPGYQLKVLSIDPPHMIIYAGSQPSDKIIRLIKDGEHFDGCSSFSGFLNKSYFCDECNRGFDHD